MQSEARALARGILSGDAPPYTHVVPPHPSSFLRRQEPRSPEQGVGLSCRAKPVL